MVRGWHYPRLKESEIRLLHLKPDTPLRGKIVHHMRSEAPPYVAISYCWGTKKSTISIVWDISKVTNPPGELAITQNLRDALSHLRDAGQLVVWADAACINQSDDVEKSAQVAIMSQIYSSARATLVWLGQRDLDLTVFAKLEAFYLERLPDPETRNGRLATNMIPTQDLPLNQDERQIVRDLYDSPWFTRLWVLQEVAVSKHIVIAHGRSVMPWHTLANVAFGITNTTARELLVSNDGLVRRVMSDIQGYRRTKGHYWWQVLAAASRMQCADIRDHWFGICNLVPLRSQRLRPDYSKDVTDVFIDVSAELLLAGYAEVLNGSSPDRNLGLPSWTMDLSRAYGKPFNVDHFATGGDYAGNVEIIGKTLLLPTYYVDTVSATVDAVDPDVGAKDSTTYASAIKQCLEEIRALRGSEDVYITGEDRRTACLRTLVCDSNRAGQPVKPADLDDVEHFDEIWRGIANPADIEYWAKGWERINAGLLMHWTNTAGKSFMVSQRGFTGWGPPTARPGDKICIVLRAETPYIFRGTDTVELVGPAYIHGLMHPLVDSSGHLLPESRLLVTSELVRLRVE